MNQSILKQIIKEEIQQRLGDFSWINEREMELLEEFNYNIEDVYPISKEIPFNVEFEDDEGRLNITKGRKNDDYIEIKIYWIEKDGSVSMDAPKGITPKTMNTHMSNIINKFLPKYDKFLLRPNDDIRFRLFQLLLNKYADKNEWELKFYPEERTIFITKK